MRTPHVNRSATWPRSLKLKYGLDKIAKTIFVALALCVSMSTGPAAVLAQTKSSPDTILIFDASRSMWGQIDGIHRYQLAQSVISQQLRARLKQRNLGLIAFGHRTSSNCGDIETLVSPRQFDTEGYISALETIKPKGKTPITTSLESATNEFAGSNTPRNIILLTDGLDNCKADPCAAAVRLKTLNPKLKIHTIAFAVEEEQHSSLSCISEQTGGKFFYANTEIELSIAFKDALALSENPPKPKTAAKPKPATKTIGEKERTASLRIPDPRAGWDHAAINGIDPSLRLNRARSTNGKSGIKLRARMADNIPAIDKNIKWTVFKYDLVKKSLGEKVSSLDTPSPSITLPSGDYVVRLAYDHVTASNVVSVRDEEITDATFVLNAGGLSVDAKLAFLEPPRGKQAKQWIYGKLKDKDGKPKAYARITDPKQTIRLNAGTYKLVSLFGSANSIVETEVTIKPGLLTEVEINHKSGIVSLKVPGYTSSNIPVKILDSKNKPVVTHNTKTGSYVLAPGSYKAVINHDGKNSETPFDVKEGEAKEVVITGI